MLDLLHQRQLAHGNLKPHNIFLTAGGQLKLTDIGVGPIFDELTADHETKSYYLAPECFESPELPPYPPTDIYALGITFFELLTGRRPFEANSATELAGKHLHITAPALSLYLPDSPPKLNALVQKCLEKPPNQRYQRGQEVAQALGEILLPSKAASPASKIPAAFVDDQGQLYPLYPLKEVYIVGRKTEKNPEVDIDLGADRTVSRIHAYIFCRRGQWFIQNISSKQVAQLNDQPIPSNQEIPLRHGNCCKFGKTELIFQINPPAASK
jgi:serine/threonine protein kinase